MGYIKFQRGKKTNELMKYYPGFMLLAQIAQRARRTEDFSIDGLKIGEAKIGDYKSIGLTQQQYRTAKKKLAEWGFINIKTTNKGTIATIVDKGVFDINEKTNNKQTTNKQQASNEQTTTNKNDKNNKNEKNENSSKEEEQAPSYGKNYLNDFIATTEAIYDKLGIACDLSNRKYATHRITKKGITQTKQKAIEKNNCGDVYEFIEDILVKAKNINFGNYVAKITDLYGLRKHHTAIINIAKKESNVKTKDPTTYEGREIDIKSYKGKDVDDNIKYEKVLSAVKFIRSINSEEKDKRKHLAKLLAQTFGAEMYTKVWEATKKKPILK